MKNVRYILMALATCMIFMLGSCEKKNKSANGKASLETIVSTFNQKVPQKINSDLTLQGYSMDGRTLVCNFYAASSYLNKLDAEKTRQSLLEGLAKEQSQKLVKRLVADTLSMRYVYTDSTKTISFDFTPEELANTLQSK